MIKAILSTYIITLIVTKGSVFNAPRQWIIDRTPRLQMPAMRGDATPPHYLVCRLCLGALVSLIFSLYYECNWLIVWAISYFMATQER